MAIRVESSSIGNDMCTGTWSNNSGKFIHNWTLHSTSFNSQAIPVLVIKSSTFSPEANNKIKWYLRVCPKTVPSNGFNNQFNATATKLNWASSNMVDRYYTMSNNVHKREDEIFLYCMTSNGSKFTGNIEISVFDNTGAEMSRTVMKHQKFIPNETQCKLLQARDYGASFPITVNCEIILFDDDAVTKPGISQPIQVEALKPRISKDFSQFFMSQDFSDIILTVGGKDIPAHKMILAACSPVFLAMFKDNTAVLKTNCVTMNDMEHEVVLEMLRFIYTDKAPNLNQMASKLLIAAEKYGLEKLKVMCAETLRKTINVSNVIDIWVLSHLHKEDTLKNAAVNFICKYIKHMIKDARLLSIAHSYPDIMIEIVRILSEK